MKKALYVFICLGSATLFAQSRNEIGNEFFDYLQKEPLILSRTGMIRGNKDAGVFITDFKSTYGKKLTYDMKFNIPVNNRLTYEIGEIAVNKDVFSVMFIKNTSDASRPNIELLVIHKKENQTGELTKLDVKRNQWMELCNTHKAGELVAQLYASDAYYYNRGRLLKGTEALSAEYSYMNSPSYSLTLTPKNVTFVSAEIAYELGQCSGSYPYPYMLVWKKDKNGNWNIMMDSNF